jgi:hypothetical protein
VAVVQLRDREMELKTQIAAITNSSKEGEKAEAEAGEGVGPMVNDQHIADIVAQWTGIPIDKVPHPSLLLPVYAGASQYLISSRPWSTDVRSVSMYRPCNIVLVQGLRVAPSHL